MIPPDVVALTDYERIARERMSTAAWTYLTAGSGDGITAARNREAFDDIRLRPRVLREMAAANTATTLLGADFEHPILLAPVASHRLFHPNGELETAVGAAGAATAMVVSTEATTTIEEIASIAGGPLWFQLYFQRNRDFTRSLVSRAENAGYRAIVFTVDAPVSLRNAEQRIGFRLPEGVAPRNLDGMPPPPPLRSTPAQSPVFRGLLDGAPDWDDFAWLCASTDLPVIAKGILDPDDADRAVAAGAAAVVVSNHGGRGLDGAPASITALPLIADRIGNRVPLILDSGIRRGTDVLKALALGASAVLIGRPYIMALSVAGAAGVIHAVAILRTELEVAMALTGCATIDKIDRGVLWEY